MSKNECLCRQCKHAAVRHVEKYDDGDNFVKLWEQHCLKFPCALVGTIYRTTRCSCYEPCMDKNGNAIMQNVKRPDEKAVWG